MERVCVIGAGSSGIASCQVLHARGIPFDCFEKGSGVGGNWRYGNDNEMSSAYESLHINTSRPMMEYATYPMPDEYPDFPNHRQIAAYFDAYVDHFGFRDRIAFNTEVTNVESAPDGGWDVTLRDGRTERYGAVLVANGHHWDPRYPEPPFPGEFHGEAVHAHHYRTPAGYEGKNVLVLGFGNSAMDIAVETSRVANMTFLAVRRGFHVIPKYLGGKPLDQLSNPVTRRLPFMWTSGLYARAVAKGWGNPEDYGLPKPDHKIGQAHPTVSSDILTRIGHGDITVKPNVERLEGDRVRFVDGSVEQVDRIVWCTGYKITFPFLDDHLVPTRDNEVRLYRRVVHPDLPGLYFIGLIQPLGAIMPIAEAQSEWIADVIEGNAGLPSPESMHASIDKDARKLRKRYVASKRHTIQVDFFEYMREVRRERRRRAPAHAATG
ncbi:MAG TPA: NAD(P)-binding domain-containing protein [Thermoleophilaceae bacterium]|nr:NAD(P)-binding domain-containing protein [Thermoleophilaceae bacterium]